MSGDRPLSPSLEARSELLDELQQLIHRASAGTIVVVSIAGSAGSGRTALLEEIERRLQAAGIEAVRSEAFPADRSRPGAVAQQLERADRDARRPAAYLIDNAQWMDATSLGLLQLRLTTEERGVLIVLALDHDTERLAFERLADAAGRRGSFARLTLEHLTVRDIEHLLAEDDARATGLARILIDRSRGLADDFDSLVEEWLDAGVLRRNRNGLVLAGSIPDAKRNHLITVSMLAPMEKRVVEAASLARRPLTLPEIAHLIGRSDEEALTVAEAVGGSGLVRETVHGLAFEREVDAERIAEELGSMRRAAIYGDLADAAAAAGLTEDAPGLVGHYQLHAGRFKMALPLLADAALSLTRRQHFGEALPLIEDALAAYQEAEADDPALEGELLFARAQAYQIAGWPERAGADLSVAVRRLTGKDRIRGLGYAAAIADDRQLPQESEGYLAAGLYETIVQEEPAMHGSLLTLEARVLQRLGFAAESDHALDKGTEILTRHGDRAQRYRGRYNRAWVAFDRGQVSLAETLFLSCVDEAPDLGGSGFVANVEAWLSRAQFFSGHPAAGLETRRSAIEHADREGSTAPVFLGHMALAEGAAVYGRFEEALEAADEMLGVVLRQLPAWENAARYLRAQALVGLGRLDEAADEIESAAACTPEGVNGERWRDKIRVLEMTIGSARGETWPAEEAIRLTDSLLGTRRYSSAIALMTARAVQERDARLGTEAAGLALQVGAPMAAAEALHAADGWRGDDAGAVIAAIKRMEEHLPTGWTDEWSKLPWVRPALAAGPVTEEDYQASVDALERRIEEAFEDAGLSNTDTLLSPAQRQARGLRRRRRRRPRAWMRVAAAAAALVVGVGAFVMMQRSSPPEETQLPPLDEVIGGWDHLASSAGGPPQPGLGVAGSVEGYYWKYATADPIRSSPVLHGRLVIFGSDDGVVRALDAATGVERWSFETFGEVQGAITIARVELRGSLPGATETPTLAFWGSRDGILYGRDPNSATSSPRLRTPLGEEIVGSPAVAADTVYVATRGGRVYSIDIESEVIEWSFPSSGTIGEISASPVLGGGYLWVGSQDGFLYGINPSDGSEHCRRDTGGPISATPLVYDGRVYAGSGATSIWSFPTGTCAYTQDPPSTILTEAPVEVTPVIIPEMDYVSGRGETGSGTLIFLAENQFMRAVTPIDGSIVWQFITAAPVKSSPSYAEGVLYFGDTGGTVYALDASTGVELWRYQTGGAVNAAVALARGVVYVASFDGTLYAIGSGKLPAETDVPVSKPPFEPAPAVPTTLPSEPVAPEEPGSSEPDPGNEPPSSDGRPGDGGGSGDDESQGTGLTPS